MAMHKITIRGTEGRVGNSINWTWKLLMNGALSLSNGKTTVAYREKDGYKEGDCVLVQCQGEFTSIKGKLNPPAGSIIKQVLWQAGFTKCHEVTNDELKKMKWDWNKNDQLVYHPEMLILIRKVIRPNGMLGYLMNKLDLNIKDDIVQGIIVNAWNKGNYSGLNKNAFGLGITENIEYPAIKYADLQDLNGKIVLSVADGLLCAKHIQYWYLDHEAEKKLNPVEVKQWLKQQGFDTEKFN